MEFLSLVAGQGVEAILDQAVRIRQPIALSLGIMIPLCCNARFILCLVVDVQQSNLWFSVVSLHCVAAAWS